MNIPKYIPQYFEAPVTMEHISYKAKNGSYKAVDCLLSLLQFTAISVIGGDPFTDLTVSDMENKLRFEYNRVIGESTNKSDLISDAVNLAWAPSEGGWIEYDSQKLVMAVIGLYKLICAQPHELVISRIASIYRVENGEDYDFYDLGVTIKALGFTESSIKKAAKIDKAASNPNIVKGFNKFTGEKL